MDSAEEEGARVEQEIGRAGSRRASTKMAIYVDSPTDDDEDERPKRKGKKGGYRARKKTAKEDEDKQNNEIDQSVTVEEANGGPAKTRGNTDSITEQVEDSGSKLSIAERTRKQTKKKAETDEVPTKSSNKRRKTVNKDRQDNAEILESNMCHQCQRNDRGQVVRCQNCKTKRFCFPCLRTWYPNIAREDIAKKCPFCCSICCCRACLRLDYKIKGINSNLEVSKDTKMQCSKYTLRRLLPHMKELNDEQIAEKEIEAKISGLEFKEVRPQDGEYFPDERLYGDICKTSIFDLHRSCLVCSCDICLTCCLEIRNGKPQA